MIRHYHFGHRIDSIYVDVWLIGANFESIVCQIHSNFSNQLASTGRHRYLHYKATFFFILLPEMSEKEANVSRWKLRQLNSTQLSSAWIISFGIKIDMPRYFYACTQKRNVRSFARSLGPWCINWIGGPATQLLHHIRSQ